MAMRQPSIGSGWQNGISSCVRLTAIVPAMIAVSTIAALRAAQARGAQLRRDVGREAHAAFGARRARGGGLAGDVDHRGTALRIEVGQRFAGFFMGIVDARLSSGGALAAHAGRALRAWKRARPPGRRSRRAACRASACAHPPIRNISTCRATRSPRHASRCSGRRVASTRARARAARPRPATTQAADRGRRAANRQVYSWPSADTRARWQSPQNGSLTELTKPTSPCPSSNA